MTNKEWVSTPAGFNRPKIVNKKLRQSYNQGSGLGDADTAKALESKMQAPENRFGNSSMTLDDMVNSMPGNHLQFTSARIGNQIRDAQSVLRQLPDVSLAANIVVSAIINGGLQTTEVTLTSDLEKTLSIITEPLLANIRTEIEEEFNFKKVLNRWVHKALIVEGAVGHLILPETTLDKAINSDLAVGLEAFHKQSTDVYNRQYKILGEGNAELEWDADAAKPGLNDDIRNPLLTKDYNKLYQRFLDNPDALKIGQLQKRRVADELASIYLQHMDCYGGYLVSGNNSDEGDEVKKSNPFEDAIRDQQDGKVTLRKSYSNERSYQSRPIAMLKDPSTLERPNIGRPVIMPIPMEAIAPIFDPSDPTVHVAYLIALDENQRPVCRTSGALNLADEYNSMASNNDLNSMFIRQVDQNMSMNSTTTGSDKSKVTEYLDFNQAFELYTTITWNDWQKRIENGVLGSSYHTTKPTGLMRLLFEMTLRKKRTQILLVPASLMMYMAYHYDDAGCGESLIEISKSIASLRLVLMYSQVNMEFQASIPRRRLNLKIDPREPDQKAAVRMLYNNMQLNYQNQMPTNIIDPVSINQSIWRQAVEVNVESDPRYPQTKVEVTPIQFDKREPDAVLSERLQKLHNMAFTLTPEQIDSSLGDERVTSRLLNNELFRERIGVWKDITEFHLTDLVRKYALNSQPIMQMVRAAIEANKESIGKVNDGKSQSVDVGRLAHNFIMGIRAELPSLDEEGTDDTETKFEAYDKFLEALLNSQFSEEIFQSGGENIRIEDIKLLRSLIKADLVRQWLTRRGVVPEIGNWTGPNSKENIQIIVDRVMAWLKSIAPTITGAVKELRAINDSMGDAVPARGGEIAQENGNADGGGGDSMEGGFEDEFDFEDEAEPESTVPDDEPPVEEEVPEDEPVDKPEDDK